MCKTFEIYYLDNKRKELSVRYRCADKSQARRLFFSEMNNGEDIKRIIEVKE